MVSVRLRVKNKHTPTWVEFVELRAIPTVFFTNDEDKAGTFSPVAALKIVKYLEENFSMLYNVEQEAVKQ